MNATSPGTSVGDQHVPVIPVAELDRDAHGIYSRYRKEMPFIMSAVGTYLVLRADDIVNLYSDQRTRQVETELIQLRGVTSGPIWNVMTRAMLTSNGDVHRRRRGPLSRTFGFKMMESLRPKVRQIAHDLLDDVAREGRMELLDSFASPLPACTIASILGLPRSDVKEFTDIVYRLSPLLGGSWSAATVPTLEKAVLDLSDYVKRAVANSRREGSSQFLEEYLAAVADSGDLSDEEAIVQLMSLIVGGSDTTRSALVIQMALLLRNREQWQLLLEDRDLIAGAVAESLRFEPSVGSVPRFTTEDIELSGRILPKNVPCTLVTMSALRDENLYSDPHVFNITRAQQKWHPVFGGGAHRCLGEALARVELEESLSVFLERVPTIRAVDSFPSVLGYAGIRTVGRFAVRW
jgi:cytochrome P450 family 103